MSAPVVILWVYIVLLMLGGLMGFLKAGSKASLIASSIIAAILALFATGLLPFQYGRWVLVFLVFFFGMRWSKSKKMMPNGMMTILSLAAALGLFLL